MMTKLDIDEIKARIARAQIGEDASDCVLPLNTMHVVANDLLAEVERLRSNDRPVCEWNLYDDCNAKWMGMSLRAEHMGCIDEDCEAWTCEHVECWWWSVTGPDGFERSSNDKGEYGTSGWAARSLCEMAAREFDRADLRHRADPYPAATLEDAIRLANQIKEESLSVYRAIMERDILEHDKRRQEQHMPNEEQARRWRQVIDAMQIEIHQNAVEHGFWPPEGRNDGECMALIHAEVSEATEALRYGNPASRKAFGFSQLEEELADVLIRVLDYAGGKDIDVAGAVVAKMKYNSGRERKHGRKF